MAEVKMIGKAYRQYLKECRLEFLAEYNSSCRDFKYAKGDLIPARKIAMPSAILIELERNGMAMRDGDAFAPA